MQTQKITQNLSSRNNPIKQLFNMAQAAQNPQAFLNNLITQNPQMREVMNLVNQSGKNPKDLFYELARQRGIDPEEVLRSLQ